MPHVLCAFHLIHRKLRHRQLRLGESRLEFKVRELATGELGCITGWSIFRSRPLNHKGLQPFFYVIFLSDIWCQILGHVTIHFSSKLLFFYGISF